MQRCPETLRSQNVRCAADRIARSYGTDAGTPPAPVPRPPAGPEECQAIEKPSPGAAGPGERGVPIPPPGLSQGRSASEVGTSIVTHKHRTPEGSCVMAIIRVEAGVGSVASGSASRCDKLGGSVRLVLFRPFARGIRGAGFTLPTKPVEKDISPLRGKTRAARRPVDNTPG